jgi:hypothetical protein
MLLRFFFFLFVFEWLQRWKSSQLPPLWKTSPDHISLFLSIAKTLTTRPQQKLSQLQSLTSGSEAVLSVGVLHLPPAGRPDSRTGEEQLRLRQENVLLYGYQRSGVPVRRVRHSAGPRERLSGDWPEGHGQHHRGTCQRLILSLIFEQCAANLCVPYTIIFFQTGEKTHPEVKRPILRYTSLARLKARNTEKGRILLTRQPALPRLLRCYQN